MCRDCSSDAFVITSPAKCAVKPQNEVKESQMEEVRNRKGDGEAATEQWMEPEETADIAFEERIMKMKKDPLFILNPIPTASQRRAQKTLRKSCCCACISIVGLEHLVSLCDQQRRVEKMIKEYETLLQEEK